MRLTTEYREEKRGVLTGNKDFYLVCTVEFNEQERAIIEQRGLYRHAVEVPSDIPPPTRLGDFKSMIIRSVGLFLAVAGLLTSCTAKITIGQGGTETGVVIGVVMLVGGITLFVLGKWKDIQANRREASDYRTLTIGSLLTSPTFTVHAFTMADAREREEEVRTILKIAAEGIRANSVVPEQTTHEF